MYFYNKKRKAPRYLLIKLTMATLTLFLGYFTWIASTIQADPLTRAYSMYASVAIYEDGSYSVTTLNGHTYTGCIQTNLCN